MAATVRHRLTSPLTMTATGTTPRIRLGVPSPFGYRPGLDGVRAIAVVAVVLYHADISWLPGGFLGVETFFVLSGYLITSLLLSEWAEKGSVSLKGFWLRRARRLLPAAYGLLAGVFGLVLIFREELERFLRELPSAAFYVYNWFLIVREESYFEFIGRPSPLRHLWSLAIEEQFYLLWPLLALWALRTGGRRRLLTVAAIGAAVSALAMMAMYVPDADPSRVYFGTDTRAAGLLIGALGAILWHPSRRVGPSHRRWLTAVGAIGLAGLLMSFWQVSEFGSFLYRGGFPLISALSLMLGLAAADAGGVMGKVLGVAPLRWIGTRSYSIYLWHWPVVVFTRPGIDLPFEGLPVLGIRVAATVVLAEVSYHFIEAPFRWGRSAPVLRDRSVMLRRATGVGLAGLLVAAVVAVGWSTAASPATASASAPTGSPTTASPGEVDATVAFADPTIGPSDSTAVPGLDTTQTPETGGVTARSVPERPDPDADLFTPPTTVPPPPPPSVTAIGDSVMAGAIREMKAAYDGPIEVDAAEGRSFGAGIEVIRSKAAAGTLGDVVVVHLGNNAQVAPRYVDEVMGAAGLDRTVLWVTVRVPRRWQDQVNGVLRETVPAYPNAVLVDWYAHSEGRREWFQPDLIHIIDRPGADAYAELVASTVEGLDQ